MTQRLSWPPRPRGPRRILGWILIVGTAALSAAGATHDPGTASFPPPLESYQDAGMSRLWEILAHRVKAQPFNLWATLLFLGAILHTFFTHRFREIAHGLQHRLDERNQRAEAAGAPRQRRISGAARLLHFLGEIEAVFGIWVVPLLLLLGWRIGWSEAAGYINHRVNYSEAIFVVVIMVMASTRPILRLAENLLRLAARLGGESPAAWWCAILTLGSLLGSFITEPGAMTICATLLSRKFYAFKPSPRLAYATLGLLFVAISVGGTLTHFAAPPVLMVADAWGWGMEYMLRHLGWKAALGIGVSVGVYAVCFRKELARLGRPTPEVDTDRAQEAPVPAWVTIVHVLFMVLAVIQSHSPPFLVFIIMFFFAFLEVTEDFQSALTTRSPILVGLFLAGLVIHGGLQQWWIEPVLGRLDELSLMIGATVLTAFNDNAAITYLCTLVPGFSDGLKYMAVAGAVTGGGLTVIANAPNPAGQSILNRHFENGVSALGLFLGALIPTIIAGVCFVLLR